MQIQIFTDDDNSQGFVFASTKNAFAIPFKIGETLLKLNPRYIKTAKMILRECNFTNSRRKQISWVQTLADFQRNLRKLTSLRYLITIRK